MSDDEIVLAMPVEIIGNAVRCRGERCAQQRQRDANLREAGAINYDDIEGEFRRLAAYLEWPRHATRKDLRHLFTTSLANAGVTEPYRQYLMGQSLARASRLG